MILAMPPPLGPPPASSGDGAWLGLVVCWLVTVAASMWFGYMVAQPNPGPADPGPEPGPGKDPAPKLPDPPDSGLGDDVERWLFSRHEGPLLERTATP